MKTLVNSTSNLIMGIAMLVSSPISACAQKAPLDADFQAASAIVDEQIAAELTVQLRTAREVPHPVRSHRSPSVEVSDLDEDAGAELYVVMVEASRLPPLDTVTAQVHHTASRRY